MIPKEVAEIADLIDPRWSDDDNANRGEVLKAAYRIYYAGYRRGLA